jgi:small-conductance mechanosensitive channel
MEEFQSLLDRQFLNNSIQAYVVSVGILIGLSCILMLGKYLTIHRFQALAKKTANDFDDLIVDLLSRIGPPTVVVISLYFSTFPLELAANVRSLVNYVVVVILTIRAVLLAQDFVAYVVDRSYRKARPDDLGADTAVRNINLVLRWGIWALGAVFVLDNLGINISALVAGLGISGIAVALAAQAVLGDALSAVSIFLDKPFQVGDFIIVGDLLGTVEHVGLKTTRIRSLHGEQLIFSNSDLTSSRIRNYKRMQTRRIAFEIGATYQTTAAQVRKIPELVKAVCKKIEGIKLDRVHFKSYGDFALIYEIVFYVLSPDYNFYMDKQQEINFALKDEFEREGIEFAYPTQTVFVEQSQPVKK